MGECVFAKQNHGPLSVQGSAFLGFRPLHCSRASGQLRHKPTRGPGQCISRHTFMKRQALSGVGVILIMFEARIPCFERWSVVVKSFLSNATVSSDAPDQKPSLARVLGRPMAPHLTPVELDRFSNGHISQTAKCWSALRSLALAMLTRVGEAQERPTGGQERLEEPIEAQERSTGRPGGTRKAQGRPGAAQVMPGETREWHRKGHSRGQERSREGCGGQERPGERKKGRGGVTPRGG